MLYHTDTSQRFTGRENDYHKYRPDYPDEMIGFLYQKLGIDKNSVIADIGSGTGKMSQYFVNQKTRVYGVEINPEMRHKAKDVFKNNPYFISVNGSAEDTTLPDHSVDHIMAAQAFHWFKPKETHKEFFRILKPDGYVALIWNMRQTNTPFSQAYDTLLKESFPEYTQIGHRNLGAIDINNFFGEAEPKQKIFDYHQTFNLTGLIGRALSVSYTNAENKDFMNGLEKLFDEHNKDGLISFTYKTQLLYGKLPLS